MKLATVKKHLTDTIDSITKELNELLSKDKPPKINEGKYLQIILSKLRILLGNPIKNPIMRYDQAIEHYFDCEDALNNIQQKYIEILELQDFIVQETGLPFIYDKYTIIKMLGITLTTYNEILSDAQSNTSARNEDINNIFVDIETMLLNDRNTSAENGTKNFKAVDNINKYKKNHGGFGVVVEKEKYEEKKESKYINVEETQKKIDNFGFSKLLDN